MGKRTRIRDIDRGWRRIRGEVAAAKGRRVNVGIIGPSERDDGVDNVQLAIWHEFGFGNNPERSFMRATYDNQRAQLVRQKGRLWSLILRGRTDVGRALGLMGEGHAEQVRQTIDAGISPALASSTHRRVATDTDKPLVDTGALIQSITYEVK